MTQTPTKGSQANIVRDRVPAFGKLKATELKQVFSLLKLYQTEITIIFVNFRTKEIWGRQVGIGTF